ncbi:MAG: hypothetical protein AAGF59_12705 [Pseudomonadota bacterium]
MPDAPTGTAKSAIGSLRPIAFLIGVPVLLTLALSIPLQSLAKETADQIVRRCAAGLGCPETLSQDDALLLLADEDIVFAEEETRPSSDPNETLRRCAAGLGCPDTITPEDARLLLPEEQDTVSERAAGTEPTTDNVLRKCAAGLGCPDTITPEDARILLPEGDLAFSEEETRSQPSVDDVLRKCAAGLGCPDSITPDDARLFLPQEDLVFSDEETRNDAASDEALRQCAARAGCPDGLDTDDAVTLLEERQADTLREEARVPLTPDGALRRCLLGGGCPDGVTQDQVKRLFPDAASADETIEQTLRDCAAGVGCPPGWEPDEAGKALRGEDIVFSERETEEDAAAPDLETTLRQCATGGGCPDDVSPEEAERLLPDADLVFSEGEGRLEKQRSNRQGAEEVTAARNPWIGLAGSVIAAELRQENDITFFGESQFFASRLPGLLGSDGPDIPSAGEGPTLDRITAPDEPASARSGPAFQSEGHADRAPSQFRLERSNKGRDLRGSVEVSSTLRVRVHHDIPSVNVIGELTAQQDRLERRGAESIGYTPTSEFDFLSFIPIDDGGPAILADVWVGAVVRGRRGGVFVLPYTEDVQANLLLPTQTVRVLSDDPETRLAFGAARNLAPIIKAPHFGSSFELHTFSFGASERGKPRGILVGVYGAGDPEFVRSADFIKSVPIDLGKVTEVHEKADLRIAATVGVVLSGPLD